MLAVGGQNCPQIRQRHVAAMLVDQPVDPQSAATCAFAAPHLEHMEALAEIVEGYEGNVLAEEQQWAKLGGIIEIAEEVWG